MRLVRACVEHRRTLDVHADVHAHTACRERADADRMSLAEAAAPRIDTREVAALSLPPLPGTDSDRLEPLTVRRYARDMHTEGTISLGTALTTHLQLCRVFTHFCIDFERCQKLLAALQKRDAFNGTLPTE